jgi:hypothetical protein
MGLVWEWPDLRRTHHQCYGSGLFVHASSSKPDVRAEFVLEGTCPDEDRVAGVEVGLETSGVVEQAICSEAVEMAPRSTAP